MARPVPDLTDDSGVSGPDIDHNSNGGGEPETERRSQGDTNMDNVTLMSNEQDGDTPNPSMKRRSSDSSPTPLPKLTRLEEPQDSVDSGARGSDSPKRRGRLDTSVQQQQQEANQAKTLGPIWPQEVPDGDGQCRSAAGLEEAGEIYVPDEARLAGRLDELLELLDLDCFVPVKRPDLPKNNWGYDHKW
eukprot:7572920-Alexandrium_andersonii.AAC.1